MLKYILILIIIMSFTISPAMAESDDGGSYPGGLPDTTHQDLTSSQSRMNGLSADQKTYNNSPWAKSDDGYNRWLNSQKEKAQREYNQAINKSFMNKNCAESGKPKPGK